MNIPPRRVMTGKQEDCDMGRASTMNLNLVLVLLLAFVPICVLFASLFVQTKLRDTFARILISEQGYYINSIRQCCTLLCAGANSEITILLSSIVIAHKHCCGAEVRCPAA